MPLPAHDSPDPGEPRAYRLTRRRLLWQGAISLAAVGLGVAPIRLGQAEPSAQTPGPYRLPWEGGKKFRVSQTQGTSHRGAMLHALDFALPQGEPVLAARGGVVIFREDQHSACGGPSLATRGNHVVIDHGDGTSGLYLHFHRVQVALGQTVAQGDVLGTSGTTGWTGCRAHLHFQVQQNSGKWFSRAVPVVFGDPDVRAQEPTGAVKYNRSYVSGNRGPAGSVLVAGSSFEARQPGGPVPGRRYTIKRGSAVRQRATTESPRLGGVYPGEIFEVLEVVSGQAVEPSENRWARIRLGSLTGFVYAPLIDVPASEREAAGSGGGPGGGSTSGSVSGSVAGAPTPAVTRLATALRQQATTSSPRLKLLPPGTRVEVLGYVQGQILEDGSGRWARARSGGQEGFLYASLLQGQ